MEWTPAEIAAARQGRAMSELRQILAADSARWVELAEVWADLTEDEQIALVGYAKHLLEFHDSLLDLKDTWSRVGDTVSALANEEDIVRHAIALRARVVDASGNEEDVGLSASLAALIVREFPTLRDAVPDEPVSVVVRFVLPRGWRGED